MLGVFHDHVHLSFGDEVSHGNSLIQLRPADSKPTVLSVFTLPWLVMYSPQSVGLECLVPEFSF